MQLFLQFLFDPFETLQEVNIIVLKYACDFLRILKFVLTLFLHFELRFFRGLIPQKCDGSMYLVHVTHLTV